MSDNQQRPEFSLPGYELLEKIGVGGYGEVYAAVAPGGLRKAVKFVFGNQFDKRATSELHALEKVKSVRHPFLLSLERIEIIDGRLIVVSELADASLRDRFADCIAQGLPGIPREELLGYLKEAADALDHIGTAHDLAHLDIKPENLLLVSGHVKVADFGLVKSLNNQTQASLVGGMTPTYAAPEVFRGSPSRRSDQYSLAILYQEMLTGTLPFGGANAAELTLQHMKDDPDVSFLNEADRFAVTRALAKDPEHRFESSSAFISAVASAEGTSSFASLASPAAPSRPAKRPPTLTGETARSRHSVTEVFDGPSTDDASLADTSTQRPEPLSDPNPTEKASPEEADTDQPFSAAPAVFIGIGGTSARVLRSLRLQMSEHLGATEALAAAPMLLLDTDPQTLGYATRQSERNQGLAAAETISLPLRRPQDYRDKSDLLLRWLGRRWLYNIPRSLRTEGIRPLGRLALVDHARQAFQRIRGVVSEAIEENSREASTEDVGIPFTRDGVRVYVVASSAGGAGSGMSIDVAYAVRSILDRLRVSDSKLIGVMTHSTSREATRGELARVNSYAWLSEFQRFRTSEQGYPGDTSIGLPAHEAGVPAFDHTYLVPLGEQIDTPAFESSVDAVAEYLFADAFTPSQRLLDACREATPEGEATVRSFAVTHRDGQADDTLRPNEQAAVARMIDRWLGGEESASGNDEASVNSTDQVVHGAVAFLGRTQLDSSTLASNCRSLLEASLGGDASAFVESRFDQEGTIEQVATGIDVCFGMDATADGPSSLNGREISQIVEPIAGKLSDEASRWILSRINDTQERIEGSSRTFAWLNDYLRAVDTDLSKVLVGVASERGRAVEGWESNQSMTDARLKLFRSRLDQAAIVAAKAIITNLQSRMASIPSELERLTQLTLDLKKTVAPEVELPTDEAIERLSIAIESRLQTDYLGAHGGLFGALTHIDAANDLPATVIHAAKRVARDSDDSNRAAADAALAAGFADPPVDGCGGEYRCLTLALPAPVDSRGDDQGVEKEYCLVTEMAGISLPHVAAEIIGGRKDYAAFAERVRTRRDISWVDPVTGGSREKVAATAMMPSVTSMPSIANSPNTGALSTPVPTALLD